MKLNKAFTLAEALIAIAIIGVVASLTITTVVKSYKDKQYNLARLKALRTIGEAGRAASIKGEIGGDLSAKDFVNNVLSRYLKIASVCDTAQQCNFPKKFYSMRSDILPGQYASNGARFGTQQGGKVVFQSDELNTWGQLSHLIKTNHLTNLNDPDKTTIYFTTADGFSAKFFYNPKCASNSLEYNIPSLNFLNEGTCHSAKEGATYAIDDICMNVIYDMNGTKGPNRVSEDIGIVSVFWSGWKSTAVAPGLTKISGEKSYYSIGEAAEYCSSKNTKDKIYSLPTIDELSSILINLNITYSNAGNTGRISSSTFQAGSTQCVWHMSLDNTYRFALPAMPHTNGIWCIRR